MKNTIVSGSQARRLRYSQWYYRFEIVKAFICLRFVVSYDDATEYEIQARLAFATRNTLNFNENCLKSNKVPPFKGLVHCIGVRQIHGFYAKVLRTLCVHLRGKYRNKFIRQCRRENGSR